jgi:hypothetical protein
MNPSLPEPPPPPPPPPEAVAVAVVALRRAVVPDMVLPGAVAPAPILLKPPACATPNRPPSVRRAIGGVSMTAAVMVPTRRELMVDPGIADDMADAGEANDVANDVADAKRNSRSMP